MAGEALDERTPSARQSVKRDRGRRYRLVPPAVTPLRASDLARGLASHVQGVGRDEFRDDVATMLGASETTTYTSFRRALGACLLELSESRRGDRVLVPAFCSADYRHAIEGVGLAVERYDVDDETLAADVDSLSARLSADVLAVVAVNVLGYSSSMDAVQDVCASGDVALLEALGYAIGAAYRGDRLGTFGDRALLNFQQGKPVPVGGGVVAARVPTAAVADEDRSAVAPNSGTLVGYAALSRPRGYYAYDAVASRIEDAGLVGDRVSTHPESKTDVAYGPPFKTMSDFQGAVGSRVLNRLDEHRRVRASNAAYYAESLAECPGVDHVRPVDGLEGHQHVRYPLVAESPALRDELVGALERVGVQAPPLYDWPPIDPERFPGAARLQRGVLTLPTHPYVTAADRRTVVETVRAVAGTFAARE